MQARAPRPAAGVALDAAVAVVVLALPVTLWATGAMPFVPWGAAATVISCAALFWRRTHPTVVLAVTAVLGVADTAAAAPGGALLLPLAIAVYTVVSLGDRRLGLLAAAGSAVVLDGVLLLRGASPGSGVVAAVPLLLAVAAVVGLVVAARRAELASARDRAARAEATREAEASRAVAEERLRIARELHDVLAHQVAVVGVQSGVAETLLVDDPDAAREALAHVRTASADALRELATLLDLLRRGDEEAPERAAPAPSLARLDELLDAVRATGLRVEVRVEGDARPLVPVVDLAAYRVVQEALTNAHKHGTGRARLTLAWTPAGLGVEVVNPVPREAAGGVAAAPSTGHGLLGMRERVAAVGGTLDAGARGGEFVVRAELPAPAPAPAPALDPTSPEEPR
ncbi:histidine kinase [Isoptericola sp. NPDC019482]|uniref:sensor histidine kinase n=1 Tax=Isoptericola sp. NPDC019482 TaxID=3154688 RepID=UPI0034995CF9